MLLPMGEYQIIWFNDIRAYRDTYMDFRICSNSHGFGRK